MKGIISRHFLGNGKNPLPGSTWTVQTSGIPTETTITDVVWFNDKFVAVCNTGAIYTSPTGVTWTARTSGVTTGLKSVACSSTVCVAVGASNKFLYSYDGVTWSYVTYGTYADYTDVDFANGNFYTYFSTTGFNVTVKMYKSSDGITWSIVDTGKAFVGTGNTAQILNGIVWDGNRHIAIGTWYAFSQFTLDSGGFVLSSTDGVTWSTLQQGLRAFSIIWTGANYVTFGAYAGNIQGYYATSVDAVNWTYSSLTMYGPQDFTQVGTRLVGSYSGGYVVISDDYGQTWSGVSVGSSNGVTNLAYNGSRLVATGASGLVSTSD